MDLRWELLKISSSIMEKDKPSEQLNFFKNQFYFISVSLTFCPINYKLMVSLLESALGFTCGTL